MNKQIKILDNPSKFLDSLSEEEFIELLNEYNFKYKDLNDLKKGSC